MEKRKLIGLRYSPWTERARWALDHHGIPYRYEEHLLLFGMPKLRWELGDWKSEITLPILLEGRQRFGDSLEIARHADQLGQGPKLFPAAAAETIDELHRLSERALDAGRAALIYRLPLDPKAQKGSLPTFIPDWMRGMLRPLAHLGASYIRREFETQGRPYEQCVAELREALLKIRAARGGKKFLAAGQFTFADITAAVVLQLVEPVDFKFVPLNPAARPVWSQPELAREFSDLVNWRDELYLARPRRVKA
ncbi:MAG: glutathione S-transferase family protein [Bdellovibrionota bacterium]